jgi:LysM repeat protein
MPSISGSNKIVLKAAYSAGGTEAEEGPLAAIASPGMNLVMTAAADAHMRNTYTPGATPVGGTAAGAATPYIKVLKEDYLQGKTVNDAYASGDPALIHQCKPNDVIQVLVASGQTIAKGNLGAAIASGKWNVATVNGVVEFLEASGGALGADTLMRCRVL